MRSEVKLRLAMDRLRWEVAKLAPELVAARRRFLAEKLRKVKEGL